MFKKKNKKKKIIIITTIILLVIILIPVSLQLNRKPTVFENIFKDTTMIINKVFMYPFTVLNTLIRASKR